MAVNNTSEALHGNSRSSVVLFTIDDELELTNLSLIVDDVITVNQVSFLLRGVGLVVDLESCLVSVID